MEAIGGRYVSSRSVGLEELGGRVGGFDIVFEATGFSPLAFEAPLALRPNGVAVLGSVTGGDRTSELPTDRINQLLVLGNRVMVGTVNAGREDFGEAVEDMLRAEAFHPGWLDRLLTTPIEGLERHDEMLRRLREDDDAIKVYVEVAGG